ncbi:MAG: FeoA family protein, partial [Anaerolineae bacterium]|nr:FeoA family protein [Anaerolineae bacterium]
MTQVIAHATNQVINLSSLATGARGTVCAIHGGQALISRLTALGFTIGAEVTVLQNYGHGPLIAMVRGTRVALGRGEASHIYIS